MTVLITGADRGLGLALVNLFAQRGNRVYGGVLGPLPWQRGTAEALPLDVASDASVHRAAESVSDSIDIVINNAGILGDIEHGLGEADIDGMARVYDVNALGSLRVTRAFLPHLLAGPTKLVVNISSEAGSIGQCARNSWYGYAMSKAALNMQSALMHNLLRPQGGRVLILHPGHVRTFMRGHEDVSGLLSPEEAAGRVIANIERFGSAAGSLPEFRGPDGELLPW